ALDQLNAELAKADHVANVLPSAASTRGLIAASQFAAMKRGAAFYNVGRGDTVDQAALREALRSGHLAAAYLDVTSPAPSPPDAPIWMPPSCFITPHIAGGVQDELLRLVKHFVTNFRRFTSGESLLDRIV